MSEFELNEKQSDGAPLRDHLMIIWRNKGVKPKQLEQNEIPEHAAHVWGYFIELHKERQGNGFNEGRITATVILDWCSLYGVELDLWEIKAIGRIDSEWLRMQAERKENG